jgi:hypothetical protein
MNASVFSADIGADERDADALLSKLRDWLGRQEGIAKRERFAIELLCREAIANAVCHGCGRDSSKTVSVRIVREDSLVRGSIGHDGKGFSPSIQKGLANLGFAESGMGMVILAHYADRISFENEGKVFRFEKRIPGGFRE